MTVCTYLYYNITHNYNVSVIPPQSKWLLSSTVTYLWSVLSVDKGWIIKLLILFWNNNRKNKLGRAGHSSVQNWLARQANIIIQLGLCGYLHLRSSSWEVSFLWACFPSPVVFLWSQLPLRFPSCDVIFLWVTSMSSFSVVVLMWGHFPVRLSFWKVIFLWGFPPVWLNKLYKIYPKIMK